MFQRALDCLTIEKQLRDQKISVSPAPVLAVSGAGDKYCVTDCTDWWPGRRVQVVLVLAGLYRLSRSVRNKVKC